MSDAPHQLDLFAVSLPPCGRGLGPCEAIIEPDQIRCLTCGCVAPRDSRDARGRDALRTPHNDAPKAAIFDGYIASQLKFMEVLREQAIAPGDPGNTERKVK
jgi:hypothetical protein